jgi:hypothetical protein
VPLETGAKVEYAELVLVGPDRPVTTAYGDEEDRSHGYEDATMYLPTPWKSTGNGFFTEARGGTGGSSRSSMRTSRSSQKIKEPVEGRFSPLPRSNQNSV